MSSQSKIAEIAGVSQKTVSRFLRSPELIAQQTARKIQAAMRKVGYYENELPELLKQGFLPIVALLLPTVRKSFFASVVEGAEEAASRVGWQLAVSSYARSPATLAQQFELYQKIRVAGVVALPAIEDSELFARHREFPRPMAQINDRLDNCDAPFIGTDDRAGVELALQHLMELGHRRIAFATTPSLAHSTKCRLQAFLTISHEQGLYSDPLQWVMPGGFEVRDGENLLRAILEIPLADRPTAVLCDHDYCAAGLTLAAASLDVAIPRSLSVIGFGDLNWMDRLNPPLTTLRQPASELGAEAVRVISRLVAGERVEAPQLIPAELVVRDSTSVPPCAVA